MTYTLVVPPELLAELVKIRAKYGISIRKQILESTRAMVRKTDYSEVLNNFIDDIEYQTKGRVKPWEVI